MKKTEERKKKDLIKEEGRKRQREETFDKDRNKDGRMFQIYCNSDVKTDIRIEKHERRIGMDAKTRHKQTYRRREYGWKTGTNRLIDVENMDGKQAQTDL